MFISIKRLLEQRGNKAAPGQDLPEALLQMGRLLLDGIAANVVGGREADCMALRRTLKGLERQLDGQLSPMSVLGISSDAVEALEIYCRQTAGYFREEDDQMHSMVAMLTDAVAELSGQSDNSVVRLQAIEKQVEQASGLDDMRAVRANLENCLLALREAAAQERSNSVAAVERLRHQIGIARRRGPLTPKRPGFNHADLDLAPEPAEAPSEVVPTSFVAAFKLQRAEHIASRFGEQVRGQMLSMIGAQLKTVLGPQDRLLRWKGRSFVMFINSTASCNEIRARLSDAMATTGQQYVEVGRKSALLSVGVDWTVFPQSQCPSLGAVFAEVDAFLDNAKPGTQSPVEARG